MTTTRNVSISLPSSLLRDAEKIARQEGRTKSELFREALRRYITQSQYKGLQSYGTKQAKELGIKEGDVERLISDDRKTGTRR